MWCASFSELQQNIGLRKISGSARLGGMARPNLNIQELTQDERLDLIEELWESLAATPGEMALTGAQRAELDRRLEEMDYDKNLGIPWDEVVNQIRKRA
jgi:putative addiction module component (TIGR02574 family)